MKARRKPPTLRRALVGRLIALQAVMLTMALLLIGGVFVWSGDFGSPHFEDHVVAVVSKSASRGADGRLMLAATPELSALRAANPGLWFTLRDRDGHSLMEGDVPSAYSRIGDSLDNVGQARLGSRLGDPPQPSARMQWFDSPVGELQILTPPGPRPPLAMTLRVALPALFAILLPVLAAMVLATMIATPLVVRRALSGLGRITDQAESIMFGTRGARLRSDVVPLEVQSLVDAINSALARLDEGQERQRRFLVDAAHELRTPIAVLMIRLESLPEGQVRSSLSQDVRRLATLAEQLLDLERLNSEADFTSRFDLVTTVENVVADVAPLAMARGYQIAFETELGAYSVAGDQPSVGRAISNLIENAIAHGGGCGVIRIAIATNGRVEVNDEGPGIPEDDRTKIFQPFYRLQQRSTGSGLGLHLVKTIVELHGGRVEADGNSAGGTCMRILLPKADRTSEFAPHGAGASLA